MFEGLFTKSLRRFKYCYIKLYVFIGSNSVHYVMKWMAKGREMLAETGIAVDDGSKNRKTKREGS